MTTKLPPGEMVSIHLGKQGLVDAKMNIIRNFDEPNKLSIIFGDRIFIVPMAANHIDIIIENPIVVEKDSE